MRKSTLFTSFDPHCFRMDFIMLKFIKIIFIFIINPTLLVLYLNGFSFHQISFYRIQQVKRALKHLFLVCSRKKHSYRCGLTNLIYSSKHLLSVCHTPGTVRWGSNGKQYQKLSLLARLISQSRTKVKGYDRSKTPGYTWPSRNVDFLPVLIFLHSQSIVGDILLISLLPISQALLLAAISNLVLTSDPLSCPEVFITL